MRRLGTSLLIMVTALAAMIGVGALPRVGASTTASDEAAAPVVATSVVAKKKPKVGKYNPKPGLRFNEPYGRNGAKLHTIRKHVLKSIDSTAKGDVIKMAAWNVRGRSWSNALIRAHKRGVAVQVIIDTINWAPDHPNPEVAAFARAVKGPERKRAQQSFLKQCKGSCRGRYGIPHSKFFLFNRVNQTQHVTMFGSNNATDVAANAQWNDLYTFVNNQHVYDTFAGVFDEMVLDKSQKAQGFRQLAVDPSVTIDFYPYAKSAQAAAVPDPDMKRLNDITCTGATGGAGFDGRTKIRIIQTAIHGDRGMRLARKLISMKRAGCDIRVVYALMGDKVHKMLKNAGVQKLQLAYDRDRNGVYDIYVHMKSMAVSGVYQGKTDTRITWNGSANWSQVPLVSDEVVGEFRSLDITNAYINWTDFLYNNRPKGWGPINKAPSTVVEGRAVVPQKTEKSSFPDSFLQENGF